MLSSGLPIQHAYCLMFQEWLGVSFDQFHFMLKDIDDPKFF